MPTTPTTKDQETTQQPHKKNTVKLIQELLNIVNTLMGLIKNDILTPKHFEHSNTFSAHRYNEARLCCDSNVQLARRNIEVNAGAIQIEKTIHLKDYKKRRFTFTRKEYPRTHLYYSLECLRDDVLSNTYYMEKAYKSPSYATTMIETARQEILTGISHLLNNSKFDTITKSLKNLAVDTIVTPETLPSSTEDKDNDPMPQPPGLRS